MSGGKFTLHMSFGRRRSDVFTPRTAFPHQCPHEFDTFRLVMSSTSSCVPPRRQKPILSVLTLFPCYPSSKIKTGHMYQTRQNPLSNSTSTIVASSSSRQMPCQFPRPLSRQPIRPSLTTSARSRLLPPLLGEIVPSIFADRMNALLASGEVPGLYEGKELTALMAGCREAAQRDGVLVDSEDELFRRFTTKVLTR